MSYITKIVTVIFTISLYVVFNLNGQQCPTPSPQWTWQSQILRLASQSSAHCTNRAVVIVPPLGLTNVRYIYDFKIPSDTSKATTVPSNVYTEEGLYRIMVVGKDGNTTVWDCGIISVKSTPKPNFTISGNCTSTSAQLTVNTDGLIYGSYNVDWGDGSPLYFFPPNQQPTYTYSTTGEFQIKVTGEGTLDYAGCSSTSDPQTFQPGAPPSPISSAFVTVQDGFIKSTINVLNTSNKVKSYIFYNNGNKIERSRNIFIDSVNYASNGSQCYQISYNDICNNVSSNSPTICNIYLKNYGEELEWTTASPFVQPVQNYIVERLNETGQVVDIYNIQSGNQWLMDDNDPNQTVTYRIRATSIDGLESISNEIRYTRPVKLFVPDTFSPNGDLINDTFELKGQFISKGTLTIYDRWGNVLFHTADWTTKWNGVDTKGLNVTSGYYTYRINVIDTNSNSFTRTGGFYVLK